MKIYFPNQANLNTFESVLRTLETDEPDVLHLDTHPKWVHVHPVVLSMAACMAESVKQHGGRCVATVNERLKCIPYLRTMGLFDFIEVPLSKPAPTPHPGRRYAPLRQVSNQAQLDLFVQELESLLALRGDEFQYFAYVFNELIGNVFQHAESQLGAFVCAQFVPSSGRVSLGVADAGIGIRAHLAQNHQVASDLEALYEALRPGVSGTSSRVGYATDNAGAGLFFVRGLSAATHSNCLVYSGDCAYKQFKTTRDRYAIYQNTKQQPHRAVEGLSSWRGTVVGVDFEMKENYNWRALFNQISGYFNVGPRGGFGRERTKPTRFE